MVVQPVLPGFALQIRQPNFMATNTLPSGWPQKVVRAVRNAILSRPPRIAVADDSMVAREGTATIIRRDLRYEPCGLAADERTASEALQQHQPDLLLIEPFLGNRDGIFLVKELAARFPDTLIPVISRRPEEIYAERALRAGASGYWMKTGTREGSPVPELRQQRFPFEGNIARIQLRRRPDATHRSWPRDGRSRGRRRFLHRRLGRRGGGRSPDRNERPGEDFSPGFANNQITVEHRDHLESRASVTLAHEDASPDRGAFEYQETGYEHDVSIKDPKPGATVSGPLQIEASVINPACMRHVLFHVNGVPIARINKSPYAFSWPPSAGTKPQSCEIEARAYPRYPRGRFDSQRSCARADRNRCPGSALRKNP
ncbi:MAG: hypothetical protein C5B58_11600 [Acidobacteria bacterium]|nr:MAG: hypothetical protein C5B58_11600 [Acidobacteriota bacterium]